MSNSINTNIKALMASNALALNGRAQQMTMESLSTGKRINRASDDSAGLSIRETMTSQIKGLNVAVRNANDGISLLETADAGLNETSSMLQRMRELAVLSRTDTYSTVQKAALNDEYAQLLAQVDKIAANTQWNGDSILDGTGGPAGTTTATFEFQIGANAADTYDVVISTMVTSALGSIDGTAIESAGGASGAISALDVALSTLNAQRSIIGSAVNRLTHAVDNLTLAAQTASESRSKVEDTDYAAATSDLARQQIIQQAATAILAQANQQQQSVLSLLK
jgi:flagellin